MTAAPQHLHTPCDHVHLDELRRALDRFDQCVEIADDERRAAYGAAGVRRARSRYRWSRVVADTDAVYRQVLARSRVVEVAR